MTINLNIMEWNIHQQGLYLKDTPLPFWIVDEFGDSDIVVLTEYCHRNSKADEFVCKICDQGYHYNFSQNLSGNDVLIAVREKYQILDVSFESCGGIAAVPENLRVDLKVGENTLSVIGVRIKEFGFRRKKSEEIMQKDYQEQAFKRAKNMEWLMQWVKGIQNPVVIMGDFNQYQRRTSVMEWNLGVIDTMVSPSFVRITPDGQSIYKEEDDKFPHDQFIVKGMNVKEARYDREFVRLDRIAYYCGKDLNSIDAGYPDHAILRGSIEI